MYIKLKETMKQKNKSIYALSRETGIAASTISNLCNGKTTGIQFIVLDKICDALDCDVFDILVHEKSDM